MKVFLEHCVLTVGVSLYLQHICLQVIKTPAKSVVAGEHSLHRDEDTSPCQSPRTDPLQTHYSHDLATDHRAHTGSFTRLREIQLMTVLVVRRCLAKC